MPSYSNHEATTTRKQKKPSDHSEPIYNKSNNTTHTEQPSTTKTKQSLWTEAQRRARSWTDWMNKYLADTTSCNFSWFAVGPSLTLRDESIWFAQRSYFLSENVLECTSVGFLRCDTTKVIGLGLLIDGHIPIPFHFVKHISRGR